MKRDAIPEGNGVRHGASALSVPSSEEGKREMDRVATCEGNGGHDSVGHGEGPNVVEEGKGSSPGKRYAETISVEAKAAKTPVS